MAPQVPPLLSPYLALPPETSLILLTSVLGASTNWLVLRYLHSYLQSPAASAEGGGIGVGDGEEDGDLKVVCVSFMRDLAFWKEGAKKLGLDLSKSAAQKRFFFIDGLTSLYLPSTTPSRPNPGLRAAESKSLQSPELVKVRDEILGVVRSLRGADGAGKVVLMVDQLDLLLATGGKDYTATAMAEMLMDIRQEVHSTILTLAADAPLISAPNTPLETAHASFLVGVAHQARLVLGVRLLDSGTARDVSGVLRVTRGGGWDEDGEEERGEKGLIKETVEDGRELLYYVGGDGGVRVFERGQ